MRTRRWTREPRRRSRGLLRMGATTSNALTALVVALEADDSSALVVDMIEQGPTSRRRRP